MGIARQFVLWSRMEGYSTPNSNVSLIDYATSIYLRQHVRARSLQDSHYPIERRSAKKGNCFIRPMRLRVISLNEQDCIIVSLFDRSGLVAHMRKKLIG